MPTPKSFLRDISPPLQVIKLMLRIGGWLLMFESTILNLVHSKTTSLLLLHVLVVVVMCLFLMRL